MPFIGPLVPARFGRPGLLGTAARTAVIAGTAAATAGAVRRHQARNDQADYYAQQAQEQRIADQAAAQVSTQPQAAPVYGTPATGPVDAGSDMVGQLAQLADLHRAGALTDAEFAAAKAKLVG